ncbi:MAG: putative rane-associated zinc metalloprotease [Fibrobacteres bacterium]|nr:putative rane-associated zinc metalloprotease [Fibrobacterota bacterium]
MHLTGYWSLLYQVPVGLIGLSLMVFIHEFGHFAVAKWVGVKVHTFSIGFGKKLIKFKRGDTEYALSAIPFGGYVAMAGESPEDGGYGNTDEFRNKSIPARLAIAVAGPAANLAFAFVILFGLYLSGVQEPKTNMIVGTVEEGSAGAAAGIKPGDELLKLNGKPMVDWDVFMQDVAMEGGHPVPVEIRRAGKDTIVSMTSEINQKFGIAFSGISGERVVEIDKVIPGRPAEGAGLKVNDRILSVEGIRIPSATSLIELVNNSKGAQITFGLIRDGAKQEIQVTPVMDEGSKRFIVGIYPREIVPTVLVKRSAPEAFKKSIEKNYESGTMVLRTMSGIVTGKIKMKALSGPIGIVQMIAGSLRQSLQKFLEFMALLNTNLAVLNILPLAITDGGVVMFLLLEAIRKKPLSLNTQLLINKVGFSFFLLLFLFVTFQDIIRIPWFLN